LLRRIGNHALLKHHLVGGNADTRSLGTGKTLGELVFHPSLPNAAEDDGVLVGVVYDRSTDRSELAIVDSHDVARWLGDSTAIACRYPRQSVTMAG